jgi:hypothetical protein
MRCIKRRRKITPFIHTTTKKHKYTQTHTHTATSHKTPTNLRKHFVPGEQMLALLRLVRCSFVQREGGCTELEPARHHPMLAHISHMEPYFHFLDSVTATCRKQTNKNREINTLKNKNKIAVHHPTPICA